MLFSPRLAPLALCLLVSLAGCSASGPRGERAAAPREGIDRYRLLAGESRSLAGCRYAYRVYEPAEARATVMLGHGFLRDQDRLVDLARALANAGFRAVTLDFCNMRPWNGHHRRNARDLRALAARLVAGRGGADDAADRSADHAPTGVVYAGFSAGALAALLAGAEDRAALGVVTLDLVDQGGLARTALATLEAPLIGLQGPPSACNANGNARPAFAARPDAILETFAGASHCEFEFPTDRLCELACGDEDARADDARERAEIVRAVVASVERLAGGGEGSRNRARPDRPPRPHATARPW